MVRSISQSPFKREAESAEKIRLNHECRVPGGERIAQSGGGEVKDIRTVGLNRELVLVVEGPRDVEHNRACDNLLVAFVVQESTTLP